MLIVFFLSIYMVVDRDQIMAFLFRLVPPTYAEEARLLQTSVSRSFGGFLRGQALHGPRLLRHRAGHEPPPGPAARGPDLDRRRASSRPSRSSARSCRGPRRSSSRCSSSPTPCCPTLLLMRIGWFVVMNVLQPRIMQGAVGIHPIVVLGSVLIGSRLAGIAGAIFGIPVAAVVSAFFFHFLHRDLGRPIRAGRAARPPERARGPAGPRPARADAGPARRTSTRTPGEWVPRHRRARAGRARPRRDRRRPDPDMTRERARTERRDLDKERGEPLAGGARPRRPAGPAHDRRGPLPEYTSSRGSSSPTTTASNRAGCSRSSRRSSAWAT